MIHEERAPTVAAIVDSIAATVSAQTDIERRIGALVRGVAAEMLAASNDQNVQRLARALDAAAPSLVDAVTAPAKV